MTTTKKKRRKKICEKTEIFQQKTEFCPCGDTGRSYSDTAGDHPGSQRLWGDQPQNPGGACGKLYQGCGRR